MQKFLSGNEWYWRLARTIVQGIIGVLIANLDTIVGEVVLNEALRPVIVAAIMAVLSPIMASLGEITKTE